MSAIVNSLIFILIADAYLYWEHRALHRFLPKIHSLHHAHKFRTIFHPIEHFFNWLIFPIGWLLGFTTTEMLPVIVWSIIFTFVSHYEKKPRVNHTIFMGTKKHEDHHDSYNKNFGVLLTLWDRTMGTYI